MDDYPPLTESDKELFKYVDKVFPGWQTFSVIARLTGRFLIEFSKTEYPENLTLEEYLESIAKNPNIFKKTFIVSYQI